MGFSTTETRVTLPHRDKGYPTTQRQGLPYLTETRVTLPHRDMGYPTTQSKGLPYHTETWVSYHTETRVTLPHRNVDTHNHTRAWVPCTTQGRGFHPPPPPPPFSTTIPDSKEYSSAHVNVCLRACACLCVCMYM